MFTWYVFVFVVSGGGVDMSTGSYSNPDISAGFSTAAEVEFGMSKGTQIFLGTVDPSFLVSKIVLDVTTGAESISPSIIAPLPRFRLFIFLNFWVLMVEKRKKRDLKYFWNLLMGRTHVELMIRLFSLFFDGMNTCPTHV
jgi:hypothetical protein